MDVPKDRVLDAICERLADYRDTINDARQGEDQDKARALARMKDVGVESYKAHGVELIHVSTDKLRVRLVDDDEGGADDEGGGDEGGEDAGAADDAGNEGDGSQEDRG